MVRLKVIFTGCVATTMAVGFVDWLLSPEIILTPFYMIPIIISGVFVGTQASLVMVVHNTVVWALADRYSVHGFSQEWIFYWTLCMRFLTFTLAGVLSSLVGRSMGLDSNRSVAQAGNTLFERHGSVRWLPRALQVLATLVYRCRRGYPLTGTEYRDHGMQSLAQGDCVAARLALDKAIRLNPKAKTAYCQRGMVLAALGLDAEASEDFSRAIALDSQYGWAFYQRGFSLERLGRYVESQSDFEMARRIGWG